MRLDCCMKKYSIILFDDKRYRWKKTSERIKTMWFMVKSFNRWKTILYIKTGVPELHSADQSKMYWLLIFQTIYSVMTWRPGQDQTHSYPLKCFDFFFNLTYENFVCDHFLLFHKKRILNTEKLKTDISHNFYVNNWYNVTKI